MQSDFIIPYNLWVNLTKTVKQLVQLNNFHNFRKFPTISAFLYYNFRNLYYTNILRKSQIVQLQSLLAQVRLQLLIAHFSMVVDLQFLQCGFAEYFFHLYFIKS